MALLLTQYLFSWNQIDSSSGQKLVGKLESKRGLGRDDYPVRVVWNSILAGVVFQHPSIEALRRELLRNRELRQLCGFNPSMGAEAVPESWNYTWAGRWPSTARRCLPSPPSSPTRSSPRRQPRRSGSQIAVARTTPTGA